MCEYIPDMRTHKQMNLHANATSILLLFPSLQHAQLRNTPLMGPLARCLRVSDAVRLVVRCRRVQSKEIHVPPVIRTCTTGEVATVFQRGIPLHGLPSRALLRHTVHATYGATELALEGEACSPKKIGAVMGEVGCDLELVAGPV